MQQTQFNVPKLSRANRIIIGTLVISFVLQSVIRATMGITLTNLIGLSTGRFFNGYIYQIFTYPLASRGLLEVVFNGLVIWFIGSELETIWGRKKYLSFIASAIITAAVIYLFVGFVFLSNSAVFSYSLGGFAGVASALCVGYAILFPNQTFTFMLIFPMKAKYFCMILIGMELYQGFFSPGAAQAWGHLGAILGGYLYMLVISNPKLKKLLGGGGGHESRRRKAKIERSHLSIVEDMDNDDDNDSGSSPTFH